MPTALSLKPDWREASERLTAWWRGEALDRVCLGVAAPKADPGPRPAKPDRRGITPERYYLNTGLRLAEIEHQAPGTAYLGEAYPNFSVDLGPGSLALYLGSPPGYTWETVWYHPWPPAAEGALPEYDAANAIWRQHQAMLGEVAKAGRGRWLTNVPDLIEALDVIASLRGTQELLFDLVDRPEWVHACQRRLVDLYLRYYDRCYDLCQDGEGGVSFTAFQVWAPGTMAKLQCDFSAMISAGMFAEFETPYLRQICRRLGYSVYHLDGPCAMQHVDELLSIEELNAIQWTPGAGNPDVWDERWWPLFRRVRDGGKGLLLIGGYDPRAMARLVRHFGPAGLYLFTWAPMEREGEELVAWAGRGWR